MRGRLAASLKSQVKIVAAALGDVLCEAEGRGLYRSVERVRLRMVEFRGGSDAAKRKALARADSDLRRLSPTKRAAFAQAYTLYLELVNICENAYRTYRLRHRKFPRKKKPARANLVYVLTAHPTESRSPKNIKVLRRIQTLLVESYEYDRPPPPRHLSHLLHLLWRVGTHPRHKPTVEDEARHIFSLLDDRILEELLSLRREGHRVRLRTWVGGDKDGHPGVGPRQTAASLEISRGVLLGYLSRIFKVVERDVRMLGDKGLVRSAARARKLGNVAKLRAGDGRKVGRMRRAIESLAEDYRSVSGAGHPQLERCVEIFEIFPALVVPLELREERGLFGRDSTIARMMRRIKNISLGGRVDDYVRGLVVSMTESAEDLAQAEACVRRIFGKPDIPTVPLFETPDVLVRSVGILRDAYKIPAFRKMIHARRGRLEVMLGYSDTAKRMGSFSSRLAIHDAMAAIGRWAKGVGIDIVFFHGSGGSEGRGGGTIREQAAAWPPGATETIKMTLQGEMIERTFATPEILASQILKIADVQGASVARARVSSFSRELAGHAAKAFADFVARPELREFLLKATPYARLDTLNIGSRPVKRGGGASLDSLRAIPWVLCWTQTRYMLPVWFGLGTAWKGMRRDPRARSRLKAALKTDPLLQGFLRLLGFALSKAEPRIFREYRTRLAPDMPVNLHRSFKSERKAVMDLARAASPKGLLSDREWLKESIYLRAPMIHPLNLLQIQTLQKKRLTPQEELLFRETVTGIAAGMLTTG